MSPPIYHRDQSRGLDPSWDEMKSSCSGGTYRLIIETARDVKHIRELMEEKINNLEKGQEHLAETQANLAKCLEGLRVDHEVAKEVAREAAKAESKTTGAKWGTVAGAVLAGTVYAITKLFGGA